MSMHTSRNILIGGTVTAALLAGGVALAASEVSTQAVPAGAAARQRPSHQQGPSEKQRPLIARVADRGRGRGGPGGRGPLALGHLSNVTFEVTVFGEPHTIRIDVGTVVSASGSEVVIEEASGSSVRVPVDGDTVVVVNGRPGELQDIQAGSRVVAQREGEDPAYAIRAHDQRTPGEARARGVQPRPRAAD